MRRSGERKKLNYTFFEDAANYDVIHEAQKIPYRFLVIGGTRDTIVPFEQMTELCEKVPNAQLVTLHNSDHNLEEEWPVAELAIKEWFTEWLKR